MAPEEHHIAPQEGLPLVSVITVVLNASDTIEAALRSVLEQCYRPIEYIVVDGGSDDGTEKILEAYRDQLDRLIREPDEGIYDAMNKGVRAASGALIGILNADDRYLPGAIERAVGAWQKEGAGVVHGAMELRFPGKDLLRVNHGNAGLLPYKASVNHPTCFVHRDVYRRIGTFDTSYRVSADHEFLLRARLAGVDFAYVEVPQVSYLYGGASHTCKSDLETYRIMRTHGTGYHWHCLIRYLKCVSKRGVKRLLGRQV